MPALERGLNSAGYAVRDVSYHAFSGHLTIGFQAAVWVRWYSSMTSCGVRYPKVEWSLREL